MLVELHSKAGQLCSQAKAGTIRCPLIVRSTSEDVITGHLIQALKTINPRLWLCDLLNTALGCERFPRQVYRNLRIRTWVSKPPFPRTLVPWDEGSTEVDIEIIWENPATTVFIEAKYGSKLSASTSNNAGEHNYASDQLARNIRVGLYECGYYQENKLFKSEPRDFVVIVLAPERGNNLVKKYRNEAKLRAKIPHSEKITTLPGQPFVGELCYADIQRVLRSKQRFYERAERRVIDDLLEYLDFKNANRPYRPTWAEIKRMNLPSVNPPSS